MECREGVLHTQRKPIVKQWVKMPPYAPKNMQVKLDYNYIDKKEKGGNPTLEDFSY